MLEVQVPAVQQLRELRPAEKSVNTARGYFTKL